MTLYTVHTPPEGRGDDDPQKVVFIKEGFCWPALFFPEIWLLVRRMWLVLAAYVAVIALLAVGGEYLSDDLGIGLIVLFRLFFALEGNGLRRWTYESYGWKLAGIVEGGSLDEAEVRFFAEWHGDLPEPARAVSPPPPPPQAIQPAFAPAAPWQPTAENGGVVGLFPTPGART